MKILHNKRIVSKVIIGTAIKGNIGLGKRNLH